VAVQVIERWVEDEERAMEATQYLNSLILHLTVVGALKRFGLEFRRMGSEATKRSES
jgi:hypothetical protein